MGAVDLYGFQEGHEDALGLTRHARHRPVVGIDDSTFGREKAIERGREVVCHYAIDEAPGKSPESDMIMSTSFGPMCR